MRQIPPPLWKVPHLVKGVLSLIGPLTSWRFRHSHTGGTDSPEYCMKMWTQFLRLLVDAGFEPRGTTMVELGPGDTLGLGLSAMLSGVAQYTGLDAVPYARDFQPQPFLDALGKVPITIEDSRFVRRVTGTAYENLRQDLSHRLHYIAPWKPRDVAPETADLVLSCGVLHHMEDLGSIYRTTYEWLKPGGYACHWIPFTASSLSPHWNGHWAYSDLEWRIARGGRPFFINRQPMSAHVQAAKDVGFDVLTTEAIPATGGLPLSDLAPRFQQMEKSDLTTRQVRLVLRRPVG